ncbi:MAG: lipocalin family protein [Pyrinomonadaceae bacterium]
MKMRQGLLCLLITLFLSASAAAQSKSIQGVWKLNEQISTGQNAETRVFSQPGMYLFTKEHYSVIYVSSTAPRAVIADLGAASADELRNIFVNSFIANGGTYEYKGGKLTMHVMVAKSPSFMQPDTWVSSAVKINGNTMTLITESSNTGPAASPTTLKLTRVE